MNTYEKAQHGADLFLDADIARESSFVYYAATVLEGNSEPVHEMWADCVNGAQAKFFARRAAEKGLDTEQAQVNKKILGQYARKKWQIIRAGIIQFHLDQTPACEFIAPKAPLTTAQIAAATLKAANQTEASVLQDEVNEKLREMRKSRAKDLREIGTNLETDIKTLRNLGLAAIKVDDAATLKSIRNALVKIGKAVANELPAA
jgi:hypothetical protein